MQLEMEVPLRSEVETMVEYRMRRRVPSTEPCGTQRN